MDNLEIYNRVREVPKNAQKEIKAGRLKGMTDINPQWRIEKLTEVFGPVGIGWYTEELKREFVNGADGVISCFIDINLYVKNGGEWSKAIFGTGGSTFVAKESSGLYTSDEVVKMAYTDAISVACKQLGFGANVYWDKSDSKYLGTNNETKTTNSNKQPKQVMMEEGQLTSIRISLAKFDEESKQKLYQKLGITHSEELLKKMTKETATKLIKQLNDKVKLDN